VQGFCALRILKLTNTKKRIRKFRTQCAMALTNYSYCIFVSWLHDAVTCVPLLPNPAC